MSPTSSPVSSASFPLSTSTQPPHSASVTHPNALIVLPISVGVLLLAGAVFLIARLRRSRPSVKAAPPTSSPFSSTTNLTLNPGPSHGTLITDPSHPAARITPFGSPGGETPKFSMSQLQFPLYTNLTFLVKQSAPPVPRCASLSAYPLAPGTSLTPVPLLRRWELRNLMSHRCGRPHPQPHIQDHARGKRVKQTPR